ncbi:MAG TPA: hypothetical protein VLF39_04300 [Candidatus Saccharimonadales bacterium]|nr:hypothetical protein [Candidatus Saccharimonadales bacterium]
MRNKLAALVLIFVVLVAAIWFKGQSFLEITINNGAGQLSYSLVNQNSQKIISLKNSSNHIKKRLPVGNYELVATNGSGSFLAVAKTHGFFRTTSISGSLQPERERQFIGNDPGSCMNYIDKILISYDCGSLLSDAVIHAPATAKLPSYIYKNPAETFGGGESGGEASEITLNGYIQGTITIGNDLWALIQSTAGKTGPVIAIAKLKNNLALDDRVALSDLDIDLSYNIKPYKSGFIVYDSTFGGDIYYYATPQSKPDILSFVRPQSRDLAATSLDTHDNKILMFYSQPTTDSGKATSEIALSSDGHESHFKLNKAYIRVGFCGSDKVCALGDKGLDIYNISGKKAAMLFAVNGITDFRTYGDRVIAVRQKDIIDLDVSSQTGFISYSFGDYEYADIQADQTGYILRLNGPSGSSALLIDEKSNVTTAIDKKVLEIGAWSEVKSVSAYGNYVFISPNIGEPDQYNSQLRIFDYDPAKRQAATNSINQKLPPLNIDKKYTVVNLLQ